MPEQEDAQQQIESRADGRSPNIIGKVDDQQNFDSIASDLQNLAKTGMPTGLAREFLQPGANFPECLARAFIVDNDQLVQIIQCRSQIVECGLENDWPGDLIDSYLTGTGALSGRNRYDAVTVETKVVSQQVYELLTKGKITSSGQPQTPRKGIFDRLKRDEDK